MRRFSVADWCALYLVLLPYVAWHARCEASNCFGVVSEAIKCGVGITVSEMSNVIKSKCLICAPLSAVWSHAFFCLACIVLCWALCDEQKEHTTRWELYTASCTPFAANCARSECVCVWTRERSESVCGLTRA